MVGEAALSHLSTPSDAPCPGLLEAGLRQKAKPESLISDVDLPQWVCRATVRLEGRWSWLATRCIATHQEQFMFDPQLAFQGP